MPGTPDATPRPGRNATIGGGGFHHVAIAVRDFDRSVTFYTEVLGFTKKIAWGAAPGRAIMLDTGDGNYLEIFERPNHQAGEGSILHFAIRTDDTAKALERARLAGCEVTVETKTVPVKNTHTEGGTPAEVPFTIAFFKGPDGELVELFQNDHT